MPFVLPRSRITKESLICTSGAMLAGDHAAAGDYDVAVGMATDEKIALSIGIFSPFPETGSRNTLIGRFAPSRHSRIAFCNHTVLRGGKKRHSGGPHRPESRQSASPGPLARPGQTRDFSRGRAIFLVFLRLKKGPSTTEKSAGSGLVPVEDVRSVFDQPAARPFQAISVRKRRSASSIFSRELKALRRK